MLLLLSVNMVAQEGPNNLMPAYGYILDWLLTDARMISNTAPLSEAMAGKQGQETPTWQHFPCERVLIGPDSERQEGQEEEVEGFFFFLARFQHSKKSQVDNK